MDSRGIFGHVVGCLQRPGLCECETRVLEDDPPSLLDDKTVRCNPPWVDRLAEAIKIRNVSIRPVDGRLDRILLLRDGLLLQ